MRKRMAIGGEGSRMAEIVGGRRPSIFGRYAVALQQQNLDKSSIHVPAKCLQKPLCQGFAQRCIAQS